MNRREAMLALAGGAVAVPTLPEITTERDPWKARPVPSRVEYQRINAPSPSQRIRKVDENISGLMADLSREGYEMIAIIPDKGKVEYIFARRVPLDGNQPQVTK